MSIFKRTQRKYVKKAYRVRNWREYEAGLRNRGSLTVWISLTACAFYLFIRVMEITDILSQNVPLEDVQYLAGHSNPSGHTDL